MYLLLNVVKAVCQGLLLALVIVLGTNVVMRYVFQSPLYWTGETGTLLFVWLSFLGAALAGAERRHMRTELLDTYLRGGAQRLHGMAVSTLVLVCLAIVVFYGVEATIESIPRDSATLNVSYAVFYGAIPTGCIIYMVFEVLHLLGIIKQETLLPEENEEATISGKVED